MNEGFHHTTVTRNIILLCLGFVVSLRHLIFNAYKREVEISEHNSLNHGSEQHSSREFKSVSMSVLLYYFNMN